MLLVTTKRPIMKEANINDGVITPWKKMDRRKWIEENG